MTFLDNHQESETAERRTWPDRYNAMLDALDEATSHRGALAYLTSSQGIPDNTLTDLAFDTVSYDDEGFWGSSDPERLTVPTGVSKVRLTTNIAWGAGSGEVLIRLLRNGSVEPGLGHSRVEADSVNPVLNVASAVVSVSAGDYFTANVRHQSGSDRNANSVETWLAIEVVE